MDEPPSDDPPPGDQPPDARRRDGLPPDDQQRAGQSPVDLSVALLRAVRQGEDAADPRRALATYDPDDLAGALSHEPARLAFWLNVYNGYAQHLLREDPSRLERRLRFFRADLVPVAGHDLSLNDVEHGMLRSSMLSWGFGYVPRLFPGAFERALRVTELDPRVHFALNCGAESCPPIEVYSPEGIDEQLDTATRSYLETSVEYDPETGVATVPALFRWYVGDFGGRAGVVDVLQRFGAVPPDVRPSLSYRSWDWSVALGDYRG